MEEWNHSFRFTVKDALLRLCTRACNLHNERDYNEQASPDVNRSIRSPDGSTLDPWTHVCSLFVCRPIQSCQLDFPTRHPDIQVDRVRRRRRVHTATHAAHGLVQSGTLRHFLHAEQRLCPGLSHRSVLLSTFNRALFYQSCNRIVYPISGVTIVPASVTNNGLCGTICPGCDTQSQSCQLAFL